MGRAPAPPRIDGWMTRLGTGDEGVSSSRSRLRLRLRLRLPHPASPPRPPRSPPPSQSPPSGSSPPSSARGAMDSDGEALLVRRSKSRKRPPPAAADRDRRLRALSRDYRDLLEETEAKKLQLAVLNKRKLCLLAEVRFLRKKYRSFMKDDNSEQSHYKLKKKKKKAPRVPFPVGSNEASTVAYHAVGVEIQSTSNDADFDLNQHTVMNKEGLDGKRHQNRPELDELGWMKV